MDLKIKDLSILTIPLKQDTKFTVTRYIGRIFQNLIHPAINSTTLSHIAIQLTLDNDVLVIIEYGQYYSEESELKNTSSLASCSESLESSGKCREEFNELQYYYINKSGVRLSVIPSEHLETIFQIYNVNENSEDKRYIICGRSLTVLMYNHYRELIDGFEKKDLPSVTDYHSIQCDINNRITLRELCNNFKGEIWTAEKYNVMSHNCQYFAAEVIKILKAVRVYDYDKIRFKEKQLLPNCIISTLWDNEKLSTRNTLGRIPILGLVFDTFSPYFTKKAQFSKK